MRSFVPWSLLVAGSLALGVVADATTADTSAVDSSASPVVDTSSADAVPVDSSANASSLTTSSASSGAAVLACLAIKAAVSVASGLFYPGSDGYKQDIAHFVSWSSQNSVCSFSPATPQELGLAMKIIGGLRVPFAVKSGGHAQNPNFSSTSGVTISMDKFNKVVYNKNAGTVDVGSGLLWVDVARQLDPLGVSVAGGRCGGVGVGGYNTGGGYSWKSQQFGLAIDTIKSFEVVLPDGTYLPSVTASNSYSDLFWAFKGGLNNFGIATKFTMQAFPQGQVWGGEIDYAPDQADAVAACGEAFNKNNADTKAAFYTANAFAGGQQLTSATLFYDGPTPPAGKFDCFTKLPNVASTVGTKSMTQMVDGVGDFLAGPNNWMADHVGMTKYSASVMKVVKEQSQFWGQDCLSHGCVIHANLMEPFHANLYKMATDSAWPHGTNHPIYLGLVSFTYNDRSQDAYFANAIQTIISKIHAAALADGQDLGTNAKNLHYSNYAKWDVPVEQIYGESLPRLRQIKQKYDPFNVMGLAGGFKV